MTSTAIPAKPKPSLNPALRSFWETQSDIKILKGGRASSKTWDAAGFAIFLACRYKLKFLCMRQYQNRIRESVYAVLIIQIERFGLQKEFRVTNTTISHYRTGTEFHFYGIHRHIKEIKGFEGADIGWIEEGEGLTPTQWKYIEPTLRSSGAELWILYNPHLVSDYVETFKEAEGTIVRHINYDENPFLSDTMIRKIERMKKNDYDEYCHVYLGHAQTDDDKVVIKRSWIEAAIDAHVKLGIEPTGQRRIGFDIADDGKDRNAQVYVRGIVAVWGENWKGGEDELLMSCTRAYNKATVLNASIDYDSIGVGAGAGPKFGELNEARLEERLSDAPRQRAEGQLPIIKYNKFVAGAKVIDPDGYYIDTIDSKITNKDFFCNLKSQAWWLVADRFRNTYNAVVRGDKFPEDKLISISSKMPDLANIVTQLSTPRRKFDNTGKVKVESKEDLAKREINSPNDADAFIMAYAPREQNTYAEMLDLAIGN